MRVKQVSDFVYRWTIASGPFAVLLVLEEQSQSLLFLVLIVFFASWLLVLEFM